MSSLIAQNETQVNPLDAKTPFERVCLAYQVMGPADLAARLGENESTVKNWKHRGRVPVSHLERAADETGQTLDWLVSGKGRFHLESAASASRQWQIRRIEELEKHSQSAVNGAFLAAEPHPAGSWNRSNVPFATQSDSGEHSGTPGLAGLHCADVDPLVLAAVGEPGGPAMQYEVIPMFQGNEGAAAEGGGGRLGDVAFSSLYLARNFGGRHRGLRLLMNRGDAMDPTLLDGEEVIIDTAQREVQVSGIYAIGSGGAVLIQRIQRKLDGSLIVRGDNPRYEPECLPRERTTELLIIGRMVWPRVR